MTHDAEHHDDHGARTDWHPYRVSVLITLTGMLLTFLVGALIERIVFQLAVVAVVLSAWYGGLGPGLLSTVTSSCLFGYLFLDPKYSVAVKQWDELLQLTMFVLVAVVMSGLSEARRRAESALWKRSEELEAVNKELEAFSYSVSHDLRRPLRAIDGYSRILIEDHVRQLEPEARRYLELVRSCTQETGRLVDDLLHFARLGRQPLRKRPIELGQVVHQALEELTAECQGREVEIRVASMPPCEADPGLLKVVIINLLQNALKFTRRRAVAVIEVGYEAGTRGEAYYVRDNGIGFKPEYADRLFGVFQRLHRTEEYEGTGVGLAIAQRIIHRHGGDIWAQAAPDEGATFFFTVAPGTRSDPRTL